MMGLTPDDALSPSLFPQFSGAPEDTRYYPRALNEYLAARGVQGYQPQTYCVPDAANATMNADGWFEGLVSIPPESLIWAISGWSSNEAAGFEVQLRDLRHGQKFFSRAVKSANLIVPGSPSIDFRLHILPAPLLVIEPGLVSVQVHNLDTAAQTIQLVIHTLEPER